MLNTFKALFKSRKVVVGIIDGVITLTLYFVGKYTNESVLSDMKMIILVMQPMAIAIVTAIAYEDGQLKRAGRTHGDNT